MLNKLILFLFIVVNVNALSPGKVAKSAYKGIKTILIGHSNYRKIALENATVKKGGWIRDPYTGKFYRAKDMDADHIWPQKYGGTNHSWNMQMLSKTTNRSKGAKIDQRVPIGYYKKLQQFVDVK